MTTDENTIRFQCQCGREVSAPANMAGKKGNCPSCKTAMRIPVAYGDGPNRTGKDAGRDELTGDDNGALFCNDSCDDSGLTGSEEPLPPRQSIKRQSTVVHVPAYRGVSMLSGVLGAAGILLMFGGGIYLLDGFFDGFHNVETRTITAIIGSAAILSGLISIGSGYLVLCIRDIARNSYYLRQSAGETVVIDETTDQADAWEQLSSARWRNRRH